jgi:hypothetical protein
VENPAHRRIGFALAVAAMLLTRAPVSAEPAPTEDPFASCMPSGRAPASGALVAHRALWASAGQALPSAAQMVTLYWDGGHHSRVEGSIVAVREGAGIWRLTRVMRITSDVSVPPGTPARTPTIGVGSGMMSADAGQELELILGNERFYAEPASCVPIQPPGIGAAQSWLETHWNGRTRVFAGWGAPPGLSGRAVVILSRASDALQ